MKIASNVDDYIADENDSDSLSSNKSSDLSMKLWMLSKIDSPKFLLNRTCFINK